MRVVVCLREARSRPVPFTGGCLVVCLCRRLVYALLVLVGVRLRALLLVRLLPQTCIYTTATTNYSTVLPSTAVFILTNTTRTTLLRTYISYKYCTIYTTTTKYSHYLHHCYTSQCRSYHYHYYCFPHQPAPPPHPRHLHRPQNTTAERSVAGLGAWLGRRRVGVIDRQHPTEKRYRIHAEERQREWARTLR